MAVRRLMRARILMLSRLSSPGISALPTLGLILTLLVSVPLETLAQAAPQNSGRGSARSFSQDSCTYRACALRIEGDRILQGVEGREVGDLGAFYNDLRILREGPDSAAYYANVYESNSKRDFWLSLSGGVLVAAGHVLGPDETDQIGSGLSLGLVFGGLGLNFWSRRAHRRAGSGISRSIWWYNEAVAANDASLPDAIDPSPDLPPLDPPDYAGTGILLGSLGGLGIGLAASSDRDHTETAEGIVETAGFTIVGAGLGWLLGSLIGR